MFRTVRPIPAEPGLSRLVQLTVEAALVGFAVSATGYFGSPIAFSLLTAVCAAGFLSGFGLAVRLAIATSLAVGIPMLFQADELSADSLLLPSQWTVELLLVALVAGYARRISGEADERHNLALDRMSRLSDANDLLFSLHQVAQDLPASLDLGEVLDSTLLRLRELLDFDAAAVLLHEETDDSWAVARRFGARLPSEFTRDDLPPPVSAAIRFDTVLPAPQLLRTGGPGLTPQAGSGLYVALTARGFLVGAIVVEHPDAFHFTERDAELLAGFAEPAALAIDNARWFGRLRTVGADEERTRIARDLHDRIGQSLAYLAFELDRIVRKDNGRSEVSADIEGIRDDVRGVVREVRDTLYDLRTDVSEDKTMPEVLREFGARVQDRSGIRVTVRVEDSGRLPVVQERELWRIAQEAMVNAERHSHAANIDVYWFCDGREGVIQVKDDGIGMAAGNTGRLDSYGMLGMRERAASIGASLNVESQPRHGVSVRATVRPSV